jgi:hypothetical protein
LKQEFPERVARIAQEELVYPVQNDTEHICGTAWRKDGGFDLPPTAPDMIPMSYLAEGNEEFLIHARDLLRI